MYFFPIVFCLYLFLQHKWQNRMLVLASCLFYATWSWKFLLVLFASISVDFVCAKYIDRLKDKPHQRRLLLWISIMVNCTILGFFKYANFFIDNALWLLKQLHISSPSAEFSLHIILPLGISFYTFEAISYVVDVYRGQTKPTAKFWDYLLFVIYFPHLIAGPIMRAKSFIPQITQPRILSLAAFYEGSHLFFWGLFEKMFIADNLAKLVNPVFAAPPPYEGGTVLLALYAFAFQIFCDFDGYSNMARGLGKCMGFDIAINFNLPYFATNPQDFWRRWHITLSSWLKDYIYIPLGGNRKGLISFNLMFTMLIGGLWHGAAWHFLLWGIYHGLLLTFYHLYLKQAKPSPVMKQKGLIGFLKIILFFHVILLGWLLFRAQSVTQITAMATALFSNCQLMQQDLLPWIKFIFIISPLLLVQIGQWKSKNLMFMYQLPLWPKTFCYALMIYLLLGWGVMDTVEFLYFQF